MPPFVLKIKKRQLNTKPLVVVLGKSVAEKAVERNLIKRRVKAIMRPLLDNKTSFTVIVKPEALKLRYKELEAALYGCLNPKS